MVDGAGKSNEAAVVYKRIELPARVACTKHAPRGHVSGIGTPRAVEILYACCAFYAWKVFFLGYKYFKYRVHFLFPRTCKDVGLPLLGLRAFVWRNNFYYTIWQFLEAVDIS